MLPSYFDYIFVYHKQKVQFRPELSQKFLSSLGPNPIRKARQDLQLCGKLFMTSNIGSLRSFALLTSSVNAL